MKRQIIKIDENKCNGCGLCVPDCPEGAIQIIDGKAQLVGELLCDGLGACIGNCPEGAIEIEEREAQSYNETEALKNVLKAEGNVLKAHLKHLTDHNQTDYLNTALTYLKENNIAIPEYKEAVKPVHKGCPGSLAMSFTRPESITEPQTSGAVSQSQLGQWPIQLSLLSPNAPYFKDADLVIAADCVPFTYADFHNRFLKGKILIIFCPKLDTTLEQYVEKLTAMFKENNIKSITLVHMEVPCCGGLSRLTEEALRRSGKNIVIKDYTISIRGEII